MGDGALLEVTGLEAHYDRAHILHGIGLELHAGEVVALMGRNGAGKSTTIKAIMGLVRPSGGHVRFGGREITGWPPHRIARAGLGYVPEDRRVFADLTVRENLEVGRRAARSGLRPWTPERLTGLFPNLGELMGRGAGQTSGGEQQMLAVARTLMGNPRAVLLDEPSEGLAPLIVSQMSATILELKSEGLAVLLSEQNLAFARTLADRVLVIERGEIRFAGTMADLEADHAVRQIYLGI
jgi:branched-chain amino acid transport system ATP-binding protein